jgi:ERCC4-related helicase
VYTAYHIKYYANELLKKTSGASFDAISKSLFDSAVDINPHQVEAALFAFNSPLSKGVLLADEVGLGKTIEAGLVLCQYWAERKRRLLVICPAVLRKQWSLELTEKFNLPNQILESQNFNESLARTGLNPFERQTIVIASYNFAVRQKQALRQVKWDLAVIDEAHKLRNVYRSGNVTAQEIKTALIEVKKLLLTATPLQNSLLELYGLASVISDHIFGDLKVFRANYINDGGNLPELKERLRGFCKRTLREEVTEYIRYTERHPITQRFCSSDAEQELYEAISAFLQREDTFAIPKNQRTLTTLVIRKLLASSTKAVTQTLETIQARLTNLLAAKELQLDLTGSFGDIVDIGAEYLEEASNWDEVAAAGAETIDWDQAAVKRKIKAEIAEFKTFIKMAKRIKQDSKSTALLTALQKGFAQMERLGANRKALIFTESCRTQDYLKAFLEANGYAGKLVLFSGSDHEPDSNRIYSEWLVKNQDTGRISGLKTADRRAALVEYFRDDAQIMIATESAAEGINLQFCSLLVNYDLPWNPQRIEQRIGRCHRYGQNHDVVVVNFVNERNQADIRVFELLEEKFSLFKGVFGTSDEVLGTIESGVDFEKRILYIYQNCRKPEEIETEFQKLRREMEAKIKRRMDKTKKVLLDNFDLDVHEKLRLNLQNAKEFLGKFEKMFWNTTKYILGQAAVFNESDLTFELRDNLGMPALRGKYSLISKERREVKGELYRLSHPLGEYVLDRAVDLVCPEACLVFEISRHPVKITQVEQLKWQEGCLMLSKLTIESFDKEEHLIFTAITDEGQVLDQEFCEKLFQCGARVEPFGVSAAGAKERLLGQMAGHEQLKISMVREKNAAFFRAEQERLEKWSDDLIQALEKELDDVKRQLRELQKKYRLVTDIEKQHECQKHLSELEKEKARLRRELYRQEDEINDQREQLITEMEKRLHQKTRREDLFLIRWRIV